MAQKQANHGRVVRVRQLWRSNDPRRFRIVQVLGFEAGAVCVQNIVTGKISFIALENFTIGTRGYSLEKEAPCGTASIGCSVVT